MKLILHIITILFFTGLRAQQTEINYWKSSSDDKVKVGAKRQIVPNKYLVISLDYAQLKTQLAKAPNETSSIINESNCIIGIPAPNGEMQLFKVVEAPIMEAPLAAAFPNIKTYSIKGITDVYANGKIDVTEFGFHAMVRTINGDYFIDPYSLQNTEDYITYYTADFVKPEKDRAPEVGIDGVTDNEHTQKKSSGTSAQSTALMPPAACVGTDLRTYRLAVACTGEYAVTATGSATPTIAQTLAKIVTTINRVTGVYETEASVRLILVATETMVVFTNASTDPFTGNNNASTLINESQTVITNTIGSSNFDIGHTFSTGAGGLAGLGVVCNTTSKARGITGDSNPVGDPYDIDYVCHEIGHQFSGNHTFNSTASSCSGNRNAGTSVEPGSGITIMGYAGICGSQNIAPNSIAYFHATSYDEIVNFTQTGNGNGCAVTSATGNQPPVVNALSSYNIPVNTPFILTGSATDPDNDALTYSWEERDAGSASGNWNSGNKPFFRSYAPVASSSRMFPNLASVLTNSYQNTIGEYLPTNAQTLNFRLTARDNKMGGGGVCYSQCSVTAITGSGPFAITYPSASGIVWGSGKQNTITWDVNNTNFAPVNCPSVNILISYNSGNTFTTLLAGTANDGVELINVPTVTTIVSTCRIKIEAVGNVFFDINQPNFTISNAPDAGLREVSGGNALGVVVLPNPFANEFQLKVAALSSGSKTDVIITDVLGKVIMKATYDKVSMLDERIDLSDYNPAVYFITVINNGSKTTTRIIKN